MSDIDDKYSMLRKMASDIQSSNRGIICAYRDFELYETFQLEHTRLHAEAELQGASYDCTQASKTFWGALSQDVIQRDDSIEQATHKTILTRLMIERKAALGEVGFVIVEERGADETEEQYHNRVTQAVRDEDDLKLLDPDNADMPSGVSGNPEWVGEAIRNFTEWLGGHSDSETLGDLGPEDDESTTDNGGQH